MSQEHHPPPRPRCKKLTGVSILSTGSYVPDSVVSNEHLAVKHGYDADWIIKRTGIRERRYALPHQATSDLCYEAAKRCIANGHVDQSKIDLLVLATFTPDMSFPSTACLVQDRLKLICPAVELQAACAGFMYALVTASAYVACGAANLALVIGGDCNSRVLNPADMKTTALFGDGAGAVLVTRGTPQQGFISYSLGADGSGSDLLTRPACGSRLPPTPELLEKGMQFMHMDGRGVFRWAVAILCDTIHDVLSDSKLGPEDIEVYIPHQANVRIINAAIDVLRIPRQRVFNNLDRYGNTSAGSVPLALDEANAEGRIKRGNNIIMSGFGAGLAWGTAVWRW
jgi:3-oxoacyl-[acyl-carrier-protein] synthase III